MSAPLEAGRELDALAGLLLGIVLTFAVLWWIASWPSPIRKVRDITMPALAYPVISSATPHRAIRRTTADATTVCIRVSALRSIESSGPSAMEAEEAEWERAFSTPAFAQVLENARAQVASGRTMPLRLRRPAHTKAQR